MSKRNREPFVGKLSVVRFQVEILKARLPMLESIAAHSGIRTKRELFDNAFALLEWVVQEILNGNTMGSRTPSGEFREICMPFLATTKALATAKAKEPS